jgi:hypothetical protein
MLDDYWHDNGKARFHRVGREPGPLSDAVDNSAAAQTGLDVTRIRRLSLATSPLLHQPSHSVLMKRLQYFANTTRPGLNLFHQAAGNFRIVSTSGSARHLLDHIKKSHV